MSEPGLTPEQQEFLDRQAAEYGRYVANQNIMHGGALAYTKDQAVPASNVERHDYLTLGLVREVGTDAPEPEQPPEPQHGDDIVLAPAGVDLDLDDSAADQAAADDAQLGENESEA